MTLSNTLFLKVGTPIDKIVTARIAYGVSSLINAYQELGTYLSSSHRYNITLPLCCFQCASYADYDCFKIMSVVADLFALAEAWRQVTFAGALITIISLASWSYRTWIFIMQYVMLCIHACNVCPRLCYLLTPSHMLLSSQVVGHWAPFWSGNCALFNFFWLKRSKKQVCIHSLHWGTKGLLSLNCFFLWWTGTWVWGDPTFSVYLGKLSFNMHTTWPTEHWSAYICHMINKGTVAHHTTSCILNSTVIYNLPMKLCP